MPGTVPRAKGRGTVPDTGAADEQRCQRDERRDQHHVAAFVPRVVHGELDKPDEQPEHEQACGRRGPAPLRQHHQRREARGHQLRPHPREESLDERQPRDPVHQRANRVRRLPRHRHLPVVEAVVGPVRQHEKDHHAGGACGQADERRHGSARVVGGWGIDRYDRPQASAPGEGQSQQGIEDDRGHEECGGCLREPRQRHHRPREVAKRGAPPCHRVGCPSRDDEGGHGRFHERRAVPHDEDVVGREQPGAHHRRAPATCGPQAERERRDGAQPRGNGHDTGLPRPDAELAERGVFERGEDGRHEHGVPGVGSPRAPERAIAGVVRPRALVVPHDADGAVSGRICGEPDEPERSPQQEREGDARGRVPPRGRHVSACSAGGTAAARGSTSRAREPAA